MPIKATILVVDDEEGLRELLRSSLTRKGYRPICVESAEDALKTLATQEVDLVITDLRLPGISGEELVVRLKQNQPNLPVVVISAYGSTKSVVEVIKKGAEDYLPKPFSPEELEVVVFKALEKHRLLQENERLRRGFSGPKGLGAMVGSSKPIQDVYDLIKRLAPSDATVLLTGESGTGKELAALALHQLSTRAKGPFLEVNASSLPATLFEAELFGARKGAYTGATENREGLFQAAEGGTLFLDEVGEVPLESQAKLLRALETHEVKPVGDTHGRRVDVRVIAATNQDLQSLVSAGRFRKDLFFRLSVLPIRMPCLRDRMEDLPLLADHFLGQFAVKGSQVKKLSPQALKALLAHSWPGNVRELRNVLERAALLARGPELTPQDFLFAPGSGSALSVGSFKRAKQAVLDDFERKFLVQALKQSQGNVSKAALASDMARKNFQILLKKHQIKAKEIEA